jgi:hypothetical protein
MQILGIRPPSSPAEISQAYKDMAKVWHPDRFESDGRLRQKAEENFKNVQQAFRELKEHGDNGANQEFRSPGAFTFTMDYSLQILSPIIDGKDVIHASTMSLSDRMVTGEKFQRDHNDIRALVGSYLFTQSEIVGRGWLNKIAIPLQTLPKWTFKLRVGRLPDFTDRFAAKISGNKKDLEVLELEGTCKDTTDVLVFSKMWDSQLEQLQRILKDLSDTIARS